MNKKLVAAMLAVSMTAGLFSGCSKTTDMSIDSFEKACAKLKLEELDYFEDEKPDDDFIEDGFYFIADSGDIEDDEESIDGFLVKTGLDNVIEAENIRTFGFAAKCTGLDTISDIGVYDAEDIELDGAVAMQVTLDDDDYAKDIMDYLTDTLDDLDIDTGSLGRNEFYSAKTEGYFRYHIDIEEFMDLLFDNDDIDDAFEYAGPVVKDALSDLTGDIAISLEIKGENIFIFCGFCVNTKAKAAGDFVKAFGVSTDPMSIPMNEDLTEDIISCVADNVGRDYLVAAISLIATYDPTVDAYIETIDVDPGDGRSDTVKVGVSMPTKDLQRWNQDGENIRTKLVNSGYEVDLQYASFDIATQKEQLRNMINSGCKVLIIAAIDGVSLSDELELAYRHGVKVIAYDRLIYESEYVDYYVTFDQYGVGVLQGEYIIGALGLEKGQGPYNIEITAGDSSDFYAEFFYNGAMDVLKPYIDNGQLVVVSGQVDFDDTSTDAWSTEVAKTRAENIIGAFYTDGTDIDAWLCSNDSTALGVTQALEKYYKGTYPVITGQDCDLVCVKNIIAGKQAMSVFKDTRDLAALAVNTAVQIIEGKTVDVDDTETYNNNAKYVPTLLCDPIFVTVDNYKEVLIDSGYYLESDLG